MATVALDVWHEHSLSADPSGIESAVQWLRPIAIHQKRTEPKRISFLLPWRGQRKIGSRCSCSSPSADQFSLCLYLAPIDFENGSASSSFLHLSIFFLFGWNAHRHWRPIDGVDHYEADIISFHSAGRGKLRVPVFLICHPKCASNLCRLSFATSFLTDSSPADCISHRFPPPPSGSERFKFVCVYTVR